MPKATFRPVATWRRMVESIRETTRLKMVPEYSQTEERNRNYRYYR